MLKFKTMTKEPKEHHGFSLNNPKNYLAYQVANMANRHFVKMKTAEGKMADPELYRLGDAVVEGAAYGELRARAELHGQVFREATSIVESLLPDRPKPKTDQK